MLLGELNHPLQTGLFAPLSTMAWRINLEGVAYLTATQDKGLMSPWPEFQTLPVIVSVQECRAMGGKNLHHVVL